MLNRIYLAGRTTQWSRPLRPLLRLLCLLTLVAVTYGTALAAPLPPPVQQFYVPVPEDQIFHALQKIYPGNQTCPNFGENVANPIITYISLSVISANTIIYYDHWEDGFEIDLTRPQQPTTQIWGDGNGSNGAPPGYPADLLGAETVIVLNNAVNINTLATVIDYDGGDRIASSSMIAMTRAGWATGSSTLHSDSVEVYDTNSWGTTFHAPVGENLDYNSLFEYTSISVMAARDNTTVLVDFDGDGTDDGFTVVDQGRAYHINGGVRTGTRVTADGPIQVTLMGGDICDNYESRWYNLFGQERWSTSYYSPVGTAAGDGTTVFVYNPNAAPMTVQWETTAGVQTPIAVAPRTAGHVVVPNASGSHFFTTDGTRFIAVAAVDSDQAATANAKADWGFPLVPEQLLTQQILVGWGAGRNPLSNVNPNENGSPVWVTPVFTNGATGPVNICVDYDGNNSGPLTDSFGFQYDRLLSLNRLQSATIFDPDGDQTGMILYVCNMPGTTFVDYKLAAAWGQQPAVASAGEPGLDLGTTAPPAATFTIGKTADLAVDRDNDGQFSPNDTILYTIIIRNTARTPILDVNLRDEVPQYTTYVPNTTQFNNNGTPNPLPDDTTGTPMPLDGSGVNLGRLEVNGVFTVTFQAQLITPWPTGVTQVRNVAIATANGETKEAEVITPIDLDPQLTIEKATNGQDADTPTGPLVHVGDPVVWTYVVRNIGPVTVTNVTVTDNVAGVTPLYVSGDTNSNQILEAGEVWLYQAAGTAIAGQYANIGTVQGNGPDGEVATAQDPSHYFGIAPAIAIVKTPSQTLVPTGATVTYSYTVSNTGNVPLNNVTVTDDRCAPVTPIENVIVNGSVNVGDLNSDNRLDLTEQWRYRCATALNADTTNIATTTGADPLGTTVTAQDDAFVAVRTAGINIVKVPSSTWVARGTTVIYTYTVTNIGDDHLRQVNVVDDKCSPVTYVQGDTNNDTILDLTEVWIYRCSMVLNATTRNVAVVTGVDSFNQPVTDQDTALVQINLVFIPIITGVPPTPTPCPPPAGCPLPGADHIKGIAVHTGLDRLFITSRDNDRLLVVDAFASKVISSTATGDQPRGVVVNEATNRVYVSNYGSGDVWVYDATTLAVLAKISVGDSAALLEILPGLDTVFVVVRDGSRIGIIQGLNLVQDIASGGSGPYGIAADTVNNRIFVGHRDSRHLSVLRREGTNWQAKNMAQLPDGTVPFELAYNPALNRLYVLSVKETNNWYVEIWKPELNATWGREASRRVGDSGDLKDPTVGGTGLAVNPSTGNIFNADTADGTLSVLDAAQQRVIATVPTGVDPFPVAVNPVTNVVFVGLRSQNALVKIDDTFRP